MSSKTGIWIFGAKGGLAATVMVGGRAIARELTSSAGLVTEMEEMGGLGLISFGDLIFGGYDIRASSLYDNAYEIYKETGSISFEILHTLKEEIGAIDREIKPGFTLNCGRSIERLAEAAFVADETSLAETISVIGRDIEAFKAGNGLDRVIAVNLASTEPLLELEDCHNDLDLLRGVIERDERSKVRASLLYAYGAIDVGCPFINFTPSNTALIPAVEQLAAERGVPYMGNDGKTGETLVKSALAPMFKYRNLKVLSWQGYNILGDRDGMVLSDDDNRKAKVLSKDHLLEKILGYPLHTHVGIDYVASLKDMKTAWDFIHFQGFMDFKMSMQFTWQGCDSILAAPLVLDMIRLADFASRKGESGRMLQLSSFFKSPIGVDEHDLHFQFHALVNYMAEHLGKPPGGHHD
jgi:myo-inositol-1-phosphate synthase